MALTIEQLLETNGEIIISKDTQVIDDLLAMAHFFLRKHAKEVDEQAYSVALSQIESFYHFEEMSDFKGYNGALNVVENRKMHQDPFLEDVYYGHAYVLDSKKEEATSYFFDTLVTLLDTLAPKGYYFGTNDGNSSEYGFFKLS